ncbi:MAG: chromosomal replication initiator protein DnaA [Candidatus Andersenbacteria bacterium CG10_big_fil_rev_8_21_14_0_10_54_11]|uniref:Chromosomal replication initiator protein DnaA n=1 Tax=Candidatus Andersenbacteria bacterium CG10_big_fil_rev_8_21_14_0_10_54_11 TaxID=1974485 RepID=A0A2M6X088_9BACT|nr:MAG: chromosomal replication initiator protein DnaA [Candidatus Andersenbacteria bacterium CG10_big_fil_rev_8_21_14_0_10_54_11]
MPTRTKLMDDEQLWQAALGQLELRVSQGNFLTWFAATRIRERREGTVTVETPSAFTYEWLSRKYYQDILEVLQNLDPSIQQLTFTVQTAPVSQRPLKKNFRILARKLMRTPPVQAAAPAADERVSGLTKTLNAKYTFETFVVGSSNEIAYAACRAVAARPGEAYNPLFLNGGVGLGKTHLLQSIGNEIVNMRKGARVLYVSSEKFINEFVQSIRNRTTQKFKQYYREVDVLIIDDVQFMAGKGKTQEELFHTFNALYSQNKQVILSSDRSPRAIPTFEERLRSRLSGGMIVDIQQPDYETRLAIITTKAQAKISLFDEDALAYIAKNIQKNVRELEGALNRVIVHCELAQQRATLPYTKKILEGILEQHHQRSIDSQSVLTIVSSYYNLSLEDLCGKSRKKEVVRPRQIAMYLLRKENNVSFPTIGDFFGGRDHTTAMHACEKIEKLLEHDEDLLQELNFIRERLYA